MEDNHSQNFVQKNWTNLIWIVGLVFTVGGAYAKFQEQQKEIIQLRIELDQTKDQLWKEIEQRVDDLEEWKAYEEGYKKAKEDIGKK